MGAAQSPGRAKLLIGALGIVYGDIGTSPIYALRQSFAETGTGDAAQSVLGLLSLIVWSLVIVVTLKYVLLVMHADNEGEGGIIALLGLATHAEPDARRRRVLLMLGLAGAALFYGDGMITPAISVLSAVEGLDVAAPGLKSYVVAIAAAILVGLFLLQSHGSGRIGSLFGPVMGLWFSAIALAGLAQIIAEPRVLAALNPLYAVTYLTTHGARGFLALGAVFLALTGAEALYADMGHFGRLPIRLDWFALVLPALVLAYFGQGALVLAHPEAAENPFFHLFPGWLVLPITLLATLATVIASQAVISGAFSLSQQAMQLGLLPRLEIRQTSDEAAGQVYVPPINWMLMLGVLALVLSFRSSSALGAAYGIAVVGTMLVTTALLTVVARRIWHWSIALTAAVIGPLAVVDLAFFSANLVKVPHGGWVPLLIGAALFMLMSTWHRGRQIVLTRTGEDTPPIAEFLANCGTLARVEGTAVYFAAEREVIPYALTDNIRHNRMLHEHVVLLTVITERVPHIADAGRVAKVAIGDGITRVRLHFGFGDSPALPAVFAAHPELGIDVQKASFFIGRELAVPTTSPELSGWREKIFAFMTRNAVSAPDYFHIPPRQVVEFGTQVEV